MSDEIVTDFCGRPIGRISEKGEVSDWCGRPLGKADEHGTRDFTGLPISPNNVPGILIKRD